MRVGLRAGTPATISQQLFDLPTLRLFRRMVVFRRDSVIDNKPRSH